MEEEPVREPQTVLQVLLQLLSLLQKAGQERVRGAQTVLQVLPPPLALLQRVGWEEPVLGRQQQANPHSGLQLQQATHREGLREPVREPQEPRELVQEAVRLAPSYRASYGPIPRQVAERAQEGAL